MDMTNAHRETVSVEEMRTLQKVRVHHITEFWQILDISLAICEKNI